MLKWIRWIGALLLVLSISCATTGLTYEKYMKFLHNNDISDRKWEKNKYMCGNFTDDTLKALRDNGYPAYPLLIEWGNGKSHLAIAFLVDNKWCFIEPQSDRPFMEHWKGLHYKASVYRDCVLQDKKGTVICYGLLLKMWV